MPVPTTLDALLTAVETRLISKQLFQQNALWISLKPDHALRFPPSDQFLCVKPLKQVVNERVRVGAGRVVMLMMGQFLLTLWSRLALDPATTTRSDYWITDPSLGALAKANQVINALELFIPTDQAGNSLLHKGYELLSIDTYDKVEGGVGWGAVTTTWGFDWQMALDPQGDASQS